MSTAIADRINFTDIVTHYATQHGMTFGEAMKFLSTRNSLECAAELLGIPMPMSLECSPERRKAVGKLQQLGEFLDYRGYAVPKLWEDTSAQAYIGERVEWSDEVVVILPDADRHWGHIDISRFHAMWRKGKSVREIAESFDRDPDEVVLLVMHEAREGRIGQRASGVFGTMEG